MRFTPTPIQPDARASCAIFYDDVPTTRYACVLAERFEKRAGRRADLRMNHEGRLCLDEFLQGESPEWKRAVFIGSEDYFANPEVHAQLVATWRATLHSIAIVIAGEPSAIRIPATRILYENPAASPSGIPSRQILDSFDATLDGFDIACRG